MVKRIIILLLFVNTCKAQDSVLHFNYWMKTKLDSIHAADSFPIIGIYDFVPHQLKDSTWFIDKQSLYNPYFQPVIQDIEAKPYLRDSIQFVPINDTMYVPRRSPF